MRNFEVNQGVMIKSPNNTKKILRRYTYILFIYIGLTLIMDLIFGYKDNFMNLFKNIVVGFIFSLAYTVIVKLIRGNRETYFVNKIDSNIEVSLVISFIAYNMPIYILLGALFISLIIKEFYKGLGISSAFYGIIFLLGYQLFNGSLISLIRDPNYYMACINGKFIKEGLIGLNIFSPVLAIISFIYLYIKKSIKFGITISYCITFFGIILLYSVFKDMQINFFLYVLFTSNILFYSVFLLTDYRVSPITMEGQFIYGIILGILSCIGYFINPYLGIIIPLVLGSIIFNTLINKYSFKLKYNLKFYYMILTILFVMAIITLVSLFLIAG